MTLFHQILNQFNSDLELVKEDRPDLDIKEQVTIAKEYTVETLTEFIERIADNRIQEHVEAVNKFHFC